MNILIANDDGIHAPGIEKLAAIAAKFGKVWVTAPANQCSGMSHRLTIFRNLPIEEVEFPIPSIEIQKDIVNILTAYNTRRGINEKLKAQIKDICPILIKGSIEEGRKTKEA